MTQSLKEIDRRRKRDYGKRQKSAKWRSLNSLLFQKVKEEKAKYRQPVVDDLVTSRPGQWYSKVMSEW